MSFIITLLPFSHSENHYIGQESGEKDRNVAQWIRLIKYTKPDQLHPSLCIHVLYFATSFYRPKLLYRKHLKELSEFNNGQQKLRKVSRFKCSLSLIQLNNNLNNKVTRQDKKYKKCALIVSQRVHIYQKSELQ